MFLAVFVRKIAEDDKISLSQALRHMFAGATIFGVPIGQAFLKADLEHSFNTEYLRNLHLIYSSNDKWRLTVIGRAFIEAVTEPA